MCHRKHHWPELLGRIFRLLLLSSTISVFGCYGTVAPKLEDSQNPFSSPSPENLIHIEPGDVPILSVGGVIQIKSFVETDSGAQPIETKDTGPHLSTLLTSLRESLSFKSGIQTREVDGSALAFLELDGSPETNNTDSMGRGESLLVLPEVLPSSDERSRLVDEGVTHLVLVHAIVTKDEIEAGVIAGGGGIALITGKENHFDVKAFVYPLNTGLVASKLELSDSGITGGAWTVLVVPAALKVVSVDRFMKVIGTKLGEEIAKRWIVNAHENDKS